MLREVLVGKIHNATVTAANLNYMGSITIDADLLEASGIRVNDRVVIANNTNGARMETYVFRGEPGSGAIELNGASAHLISAGDQIIIFHYGLVSDEEYKTHRPRVVLIGEGNRIGQTLRYEPNGG